MRKLVLSLAGAAVLSAGLATSASATPSASSSHSSRSVVALNGVAGNVEQAQGKKPFRIRAGKSYDVTVRVRVTRKGYGDALEVKVVHGWRVVHKWHLHRGTYRFRHEVRTASVGMVKLRWQITHHGHLQKYKTAYSNTFRVLAYAKHHRPHGHRPSVFTQRPTMTPAQTVRAAPAGWSSIECAYGGTGDEQLVSLGNADLVHSPLWHQHLAGSEWVWQQLYYSENTGNGWSAWTPQITDSEQYIQPSSADPVIAPYVTSSDQLGDLSVQDANNDAQWTFAWRLLAWDGTQWVSTYNNGQFLTPSAYLQWSNGGNDQDYSSTCYTSVDGGL